jgi:hypothetical protein
VESNLWVTKGLDTELEEHSNSSVLCERRFWWEWLFAEGQFASIMDPYFPCHSEHLQSCFPMN